MVMKSSGWKRLNWDQAGAELIRIVKLMPGLDFTIRF